MTAYPTDVAQAQDPKKKTQLVLPWRDVDTDENINAVKPYQWKAVEQGVTNALRTGPLMSLPVSMVTVKI
jgi:hypothetical protein